MNFLEKSAGYIYRNYGEKLSTCCIVLPNKRASLFLKSYLSRYYDKPFFTPTFLTINDLAQELSGLKIIDNINLLFHLYTVHQKIEGEEAQAFDQFMKWGHVLIADFNDIDQYLIDAKSLYGYLSESKAIEKWTLGSKELTEFELSYLHFFNSLYDYYDRFKKLLLNEKKAYQGLALRMSTERIEDHRWIEQFSKAIFIGFNALSASEERIIKSLTRAGNADVLWDADSYYMDSSIQEAGRFLREYRRSWDLREFNWVEDNILKGEKSIEIIGVPKMAGQAKIAGELLSRMGDGNDDRVDMAMVLAEESLLIPVLNSIPVETGPFNVTMGLGLENTPLYNLLEAVLVFHENAQRIKSSGKPLGEDYFTRDLINILKHPYTRIIEQTDESQPDLNSIIEDLNQRNQVFTRASVLREMVNTAGPVTINFFNTLFQPWTSPLGAIGLLSELMQSLKDLFIIRKEKTGLDHKLEFEYLYEFSRLLTSFRNTLAAYQVNLEIKTLRKILNRIFRMSSLPFYGEPLKGIQIMGMLETRALDFDKLIILSANEGILPRGKDYSSFIPFDVRRYFNLPTFREKDAIFAYHFYRLIQRARQISIVYNTESDELGGGDKSRFIKQIIHELPSRNPGIRIREYLLGSEVKSYLPPPIEIPKDGDIMKKLLTRAEKGFSPSSLNLFIRCPLKFFFTEVMEISEPEEIEEGIDAATLGNVVHLALKKLLAPQLDKELLQERIAFSEKDIVHEVDLAFKEFYSGGETAYGKNYLITRVAVQWISRLLHPDHFSAAGLPERSWKIIELERRFSSQLEVTINLERIRIGIKGTIDRVDIQDGRFLVIDYKTGMAKPSDLNIPDWEKLGEESRYAQALQLLIYSYLLLQDRAGESNSCVAGIWSVPRSSQGLMHLKEGHEILIIDAAIALKINKLIESILERIFDTNVPFKQTGNPDNCRFCPFAGTCERPG